MNDFINFPSDAVKNIKYVLTDIDDTLTNDGYLSASAYSALESLQQSGIKVIPITGRPAGWCDHIARMWPVDGVVGENGALYFYYDKDKKQMIRRYWRSDEQRLADTKLLQKIEQQVLREVQGCAVSVDQPYRAADLAIDFCEDVEPLGAEQVQKIVTIFEEAGAIAKVSSIHVNGWFGDYDKLAMTGIFFKEIFGIDMSQINSQVIFSGDSPNDAPMFSYFENSIGVANIKDFVDQLSVDEKPSWVTEKKGGYGFAEIAKRLVER